MPTILRADGMRFVIYVDDHPPPHVHALGNGAAKINIDGAVLVQDQGMSKRDVKRAQDVVQEHRALLTDAWNEMHG